MGSKAGLEGNAGRLSKLGSVPRRAGEEFPPVGGRRVRDTLTPTPTDRSRQLNKLGSPNSSDGDAGIQLERVKGLLEAFRTKADPGSGCMQSLFEGLVRPQVLLIGEGLYDLIRVGEGEETKVGTGHGGGMIGCGCWQGQTLAFLTCLSV